MSSDVILNSGLFVPEYALGDTISDFETKLVMHWERYLWDKNYLNRKYDLFYSFFQDIVTDEWVSCNIKHEGDTWILYMLCQVH